MNTHIANRRTRQLAAIIAAAALTAAACSSGGDEQATDGVASVATTEAASTSGTEPAATTTKPPPSTTTIDPRMEPIPPEAFNPNLPESVEPEYRLDTVNTDTSRTPTTTTATITATTRPVPTTTNTTSTSTTSTAKPAATTSTTKPVTTSTTISPTVTTGTTNPDIIDTSDGLPKGAILETQTGVLVEDAACQKALVAWWDALQGVPHGLVAVSDDYETFDDLSAVQRDKIKTASDIAFGAWTTVNSACHEVADPASLHTRTEHQWAEYARYWAQIPNTSLAITTGTGLIITDPECKKAVLAWYEALDELVAARGDKERVIHMTADEMRRLRSVSNVAWEVWNGNYGACRGVVDDTARLFHENEHTWADLAGGWTWLLDLDAAENGYWCTRQIYDLGFCDEVDDPYLAPDIR